MNKACYIYLRVSTDEQAKEGFSLDNQKRACVEYAKNNGYQIKSAFLEEGKSARTVERPEFQKLLKAVDDNPVDSVIVYKIDRFARNVADFSRIRKEFRNKGVSLISIVEGGDVGNGLIGNIFASVAEWESEVNGQRTKDALRQKYRDGWWPGWAPVGYKNIRKNNKKIVVPDPITAPLVEETFNLYSTGNYSYVRLSKEMFSKGLTARNGKMFCDSSLQQLLSNPFFYGLMKWGGTEKTGNHTPLITKALFDQCQLTAAKHRQFLIRQRKHNFLLRGIVFCSEHSSRLTAEWHYYHHNGYKKDRIGYYHCYTPGGCPGSFIELEDMEKRVANLFKNFQFGQEFTELVRQKIRKHFEGGRKTFKSERQIIVNQKRAIEKHRNKLEDLLVEGVIGRDVFKRQHIKLQEQINNLNDRLVELEGRQKLDINLVDEVLALTRNIHQTYLEAPPHLKRHYLRFFFEGIYIKDKEITRVVETPVFATLRRQNHIIIRSHLLPRLDSNQQP
ncbi:MAG: Site-specific recombinase, DNA invertase Pin [Candidatus Woesebacteria bacterium GW2011_GWA2_40_7]|uniref:Site-specific recombinase, DNA invertase Pin n=3 Tax=Candidatus Woeseibacteriota TaxID=1752722 RepID=A0A0G0LJZ4_9BACT|nr:MAG: Site-specific recombinase, DNA invertase Pin [Candidatus Woesebacteria bacterium GW2011_GWB1_39_10]KKR72949.1 MAG: Site-specific recombinase, DNA invertase Pin [Candidatus Woesebacteria bacterium GW2011_GWA2_40_7]KKS91178.1 MAG: Site-specific recombinase, DNA invertase Pin [Candidatus Woesebacteria bacterium GW2011_GWA1_43_12]